MDAITPSIQRLSRKLLATGKVAAGSPSDNAIRVCETLRASLTRFAGAEGYASLLRRALVLAAAEERSLQGFAVGRDGRLQLNPEQGLRDGISKRDAVSLRLENKAGVALISHLLALLDTFIGERLVISLLSEGWPEISFEQRMMKPGSDT